LDVSPFLCDISLYKFVPANKRLRVQKSSVSLIKEKFIRLLIQFEFCSIFPVKNAQ
jgi:hypothetical protein